MHLNIELILELEYHAFGCRKRGRKIVHSSAVQGQDSHGKERVKTWILVKFLDSSIAEFIQRITDSLLFHSLTKLIQHLLIYS